MLESFSQMNNWLCSFTEFVFFSSAISHEGDFGMNGSFLIGDMCLEANVGIKT